MTATTGAQGGQRTVFAERDADAFVPAPGVFGEVEAQAVDEVGRALDQGLRAGDRRVGRGRQLLDQPRQGARQRHRVVVDEVVVVGHAELFAGEGDPEVVGLAEAARHRQLEQVHLGRLEADRGHRVQALVEHHHHLERDPLRARAGCAGRRRASRCRGGGRSPRAPWRAPPAVASALPAGRRPAARPLPRRSPHVAGAPRAPASAPARGAPFCDVRQGRRRRSSLARAGPPSSGGARVEVVDGMPASALLRVVLSVGRHDSMERISYHPRRVPCHPVPASRTCRRDAAVRAEES